jgi:hypothetical protein
MSKQGASTGRSSTQPLERLLLLKGNIRLNNNFHQFCLLFPAFRQRPLSV